MGDIIQRHPIRFGAGKARRVRVYYDSGSPWTFVKHTLAEGRPDVLALHRPRAFGGLGNGSFTASHLADIEFQILGVWCHHPVFVVADNVLNPEYEVLAGHDFMQRYHISLDMTNDRIIAKRSRLKSANLVLRSRRP